MQSLPTRPFFQRVWAATRTIPKGSVATYGDIARMVGTRDARRVGQALHANKDINTPCHRVVFTNGSLAPGYAFGGPEKQREKLTKEGISFTKDGKVSLTKYRLRLEKFLL